LIRLINSIPGSVISDYILTLKTAKITFYSGHLPALFIVFDILMARFHLLPRPLAREIMALTNLTSAFSQPICPDRFSSDDYRVSMRKPPHVE
jgi:hypothetical protein